MPLNSRQLMPVCHPGWANPSRLTRFLGPSSFLGACFSPMVASVILLALISGCTKQSGGVLDPSGIPPFVEAAAAFPDSIKMKSLPQANGSLTVTIRAQAKIIRQAGSAAIATVNASVTASGGIDPILTVALHDDGSLPDSVAGDGIYSALMQFTIPRSASGIYTLKVVASDIQGFVSNAVESPLFMVRDNQAPVLSNLVAPDAVVIPAGGSANIPLYIRATDPDGQADIIQVYFRSLDSSDPAQKFTMNNDGSAPGSVPGDSTYSIIVKASDSPTVRKTYRFAFQAIDTFGDTSATILHSITLQ